jgi:GNAT superfamily N-acetyltransferase
MVRIAAFTLFALLLARVMRAPAGTWRWILGAAVAVVLGSQLLPEGNAFREDVRGSLGALFWIGLALLPVAAYALVIRRLRARTGVDAELRPARPTGLVLVEDDARLAADTAGAWAAETGAETLSVGWRDEAGAMAGHARLRLAAGTAALETLWVAPPARGGGIGARLLAQAEAEARDRGAGRLVATALGPAAEGFLLRRGFAVYGRLDGGDGRSHLVKALE